MANRMAAVVSEDSGAFTMGRLFSEIGGELTRQNVSDITEALIEEGMDKRTAKKNARILWYVVKNGPVSGAQAQMIEGNDILAKVMREVVIDPYSTVDPQSIGYNEILRRLARETVARESRYRFGTGNPSPTGPEAGGAGGRAWMSQGGDNAAVAAFAPQGEGFGSGWQGDRTASAERNGAKLEAAQGAGADTPNAGGSFEQQRAENAADWETTEDLPVEESSQSGIMKMQNTEVRKWYKDSIAKIPDSIDKSFSIEKQARQAFEARNSIRAQARNMMADEETRKKLDKERPNKTFEELIESKMKRKHMTREAAIKDILETATKSNADVDKELGVDDN